MPVHGHRDWMMDSVQSIIDQTYQDWKLIILSDEPEMNYGLYKMLDKRIEVMVTDQPQSAEQMINHASKDVVKTKYMAIQYADCVSLPQRFKVQFKVLEDTKKSLCTSDCIDFHPNGRKYVQRMAMFQDAAADFATSPTMFMLNQVMIDNPYRLSVKLWSDIHWCEDLWNNHSNHKHQKIDLPLVYRFDRDKTLEWRSV